MTFQAYLDTIREKTGLGPDDFRRLAAEKGFDQPGVKAGAIIAWLKEDYGLGPGHGMAIVSVIQARKEVPVAEKVDRIFAGAKARWRPAYETVLATVEGFGPVAVMPTDSYVSLVRDGRKFAIVAAIADRLDVGVKVPGAAPTARFEASGSWNAMVTHRVRVTDPAQLDDELTEWLRRAYDAG